MESDRSGLGRRCQAICFRRVTTTGRRSAPGLFLIGLLLAGSFAYGQEKHRVLVIVSSELADIWENRAIDALDVILDPDRYVIDSWVDFGEEDCAQPACLRHVVERHRADYVVGVDIKRLRPRRGFRVRAWLYDRDQPTSFRAESGRDCQGCDPRAAIDAVSSSIESLFNGKHGLPEPAVHRPFDPEFCGHPDCVNGLSGHKLIVLPIVQTGHRREGAYGRYLLEKVHSTTGLLLRVRPILASERACDKPSCLRRLAAKYHVRLILGGHVHQLAAPADAKSYDFDIQMWVYDAESSDGQLRERHAVCASCWVFDAEEMVAQIAGRLLGDEATPALQFETPFIRSTQYKLKPAAVLPCAAQTKVGVMPVRRGGWFESGRLWLDNAGFFLEAFMHNSGLRSRPISGLSLRDFACKEVSCLRRIASQHHVDWLVGAEIINDQQLPPSYHFSLWLFDGSLVVTSRQSCWNCSMQQTSMRMTDALADFLEVLPLDYPESSENGVGAPRDCRPIPIAESAQRD